MIFLFQLQKVQRFLSEKCSRAVKCKKPGTMIWFIAISTNNLAVI